MEQNKKYLKIWVLGFKNENFIELVPFSFTFRMKLLQQTRIIRRLLSTPPLTRPPETLPIPIKPNIFTRFKEIIGFQGEYRYYPHQMKYAAKQIYAVTTKGLPFLEFHQICNISDTFTSFASLMFLHVYMVILRLMLEQRSGQFVRNELVKSMWLDFDTRLSTLSGLSATQRGEEMKKLDQIFIASMIGYDEGNNDIDLKTSELNEYPNADPDILLTLVKYVRRNIYHLEHSIDSKTILTTGLIDFVALDEANDQEQAKLHGLFIAH
ncbi:hypothetical protein ACOME3_006988 [Neoechinorhynchus agilis]